ncbi:hypothetical protein B296_00006491 [Ensete ventricosum]|uniref:C2 domain-containing protein n=1 Tax=Ensete ventricosum TaxID=4639 RepID=A0A427A6W7_ENSVE|nr:hypothetical protein B296_00006491 [Ensete ventricosum]
MERTATTVEITIISAEELRHGRRPLDKGAFVAVRSGSDTHSQVATGVDRDGGGYPCWNEKLTMTLPPRSMSVGVYCRSKMGAGAARAVAAAEVPVSDFLWLEDYLHLLSYKLRDSNGVGNGIINFSVRVIGGEGKRGACLYIEEVLNVTASHVSRVHIHLIRVSVSRPRERRRSRR